MHQRAPPVRWMIRRVTNSTRTASEDVASHSRHCVITSLTLFVLGVVAMRVLLLCSVTALIPFTASADPQCVFDAGQIAEVGESQPTTGGVGLPLPRSSVPLFEDRPTQVPLPPVAARITALDHVIAAGAQITDAGTSHGLRAIVARNDGQFVRFYVAPDEQALVGGLMSDLSVADLVAMASGNVKKLGRFHGLQAIFVPNGKQFQVFYATPDGQRVIPGAMFDAAGKNLTRDHVASIPGAIPTVVIGDEAPRPPTQVPSAPESILKAMDSTTFGTTGLPSAPRLWVFIDPLCSWSVRAMEQLRPYVASGRLQLAVVPVSVLDREDAGRSTLMAKAMLSLPRDAMVAAWSGNKLPDAAEPSADLRLAANQAAAGIIGLRGTPTILWRKADGTEGRADGLPSNLDALVASIGGMP